jgi:hypothetical protein
MELAIQFVSAEINKTTANVVKLTENLLGHGHTVSMDNFYISPELAWFLKSKKTDCVGTLRDNRNNAPPPLVKNMKLNKESTVVNTQAMWQFCMARQEMSDNDLYIPQRRYACGCK